MITLNIYDSTWLFLILFMTAMLAVIMMVTVPKNRPDFQVQEDQYSQEQFDKGGCLFGLSIMILSACGVGYLIWIAI
jgi:hypothetical protein